MILLTILALLIITGALIHAGRDLRDIQQIANKRLSGPARRETDIAS